MRLCLCAVFVIGLLGCNGQICSDYVPHVVLTDVGYDEAKESLALSYYMNLGHCSEDDNKYESSLAIIDFHTKSVDVDQRSSKELKLYNLPESYTVLFGDSEFNTWHCTGCELQMPGTDGKYDFVFATQGEEYDDSQAPMTLRVWEGTTETMVWSFGWDEHEPGTDSGEDSDGVDGGLD